MTDNDTGSWVGDLASRKDFRQIHAVVRVYYPPNPEDGMSARYPMLVDPTLTGTAHAICARLHDAGHQALFAGGAVRDALLGRDPHDIDIATSATPDQVEALFDKTVAVGKAFGVIVVVMDGVEYEVATFRKEAGYEDGRHPTEVQFSDAREDAKRRDFTVNGLFYDPASDEIIDHVDGVRDIDRRMLRAVGDPFERFEEDRLRMMRGVRFTANLGFDLDPATEEAISRESRHLPEVSAERIRDELLKILRGPRPAMGIELLRTTGLLETFLPELLDQVGCEQSPQHHPEGDVWTHTMKMLKTMARDATKAGQPTSAHMALAVLLHDIAKPATRTEGPDRIRFDGHDKKGAVLAEAVLKRLKCDRKTIQAVSSLVAGHMKFLNVHKMRHGRLVHWMRDELFPLQLELHRLDAVGSNNNLWHHDFAAKALAAIPPEAPPRLITGKDLIEMGVTPGPELGGLLQEIGDRIVEEGIETREAAMELARQVLSE